MSATDLGRTYHTQCTGPALGTVKAHEKEESITLFGGCYCPFSQRVWVALEYLQIPYKYHEADATKKPKELMELSPKGLVPALKLHDYNPPRALNESTVILEYLEDLATDGKSLLPPKDQPYARALVRLVADHISRNIVPAFFRFLQAQETSAQILAGTNYATSLETLFSLFDRIEKEQETAALGLWREGGQLTLADVLVGPWLFRTTNVLKHYRGFELPGGDKGAAYIRRVMEHPAFQATTSDEQLYIDSYERYAFNRPNTSLIADAIARGEGLP